MNTTPKLVVIVCIANVLHNALSNYGAMKTAWLAKRVQRFFKENNLKSIDIIHSEGRGSEMTARILTEYIAARKTTLLAKSLWLKEDSESTQTDEFKSVVLSNMLVKDAPDVLIILTDKVGMKHTPSIFHDINNNDAAALDIITFDGGDAIFLTFEDGTQMRVLHNAAVVKTSVPDSVFFHDNNH